MRLIDGDELMERLRKRFYAHDLKSDFDRCARSVILSCMEAVQRAATICEPPNNPLTLKELREMDGEPVFVRLDNGYWGIVDCKESVIAMPGHGILPFAVSRGLAYRRKPEERTT